jgi:hypothetical protein
MTGSWVSAVGAGAEVSPGAWVLAGAVVVWPPVQALRARLNAITTKRACLNLAMNLLLIKRWVNRGQSTNAALGVV